jgi:hypothetical protein
MMIIDITEANRIAILTSQPQQHYFELTDLTLQQQQNYFDVAKDQQ